MIRIEKASETRVTTITVDGQLSGDNLVALETCVNQAIDERKPVHLFLRDVSNIDERAHGLLCGLVAKSVHLSASGIYSSYVVANIIRERRKSANGNLAAENRHLTQQAMRRKTGMASECTDAGSVPDAGEI